MTASRVSHRELAERLQALRVGVNASDLHGSLCGFLCGNGATDETSWLDALELGVDVPALREDALLRRMYRACRGDLERMPPAVQPLLPAAGATLPQRADALVEWCRGFLGGFGLSGAAAGAMSDETREILADFAGIAASSFDYGEDSESEEQALGDVVAFVGTAAALLHRAAGETRRSRLLH